MEDKRRKKVTLWEAAEYLDLTPGKVQDMVDRGVLKARDFRGGDEAGGVFLTEKGRKTFLEAYEARLKETVKHPKLGRSVSYRRLIRLDLYKLEKHLLGDESYVPYVSRW